MKMDSAYLLMTPKVLRRVVKRVVRKLTKLKKKVKFDTIAFRGNSGASVAFPVAVEMGIQMALIRKGKDQESSHGDPIEGAGEMKNYIILDDFIFSGTTIDTIYNKIQTRAKDLQHTDVKCVGIALYNNDSSKKIYRICTTRGPNVEVPIFTV